MQRITIYTTSYCGYCRRAKAILDGKGVAYDEVDVTDDPAKREWLVETTGRTTVPQIFVGERPIGGHDDLVALIRDGKFEPLLRGHSPLP